MKLDLMRLIQRSRHHFGNETIRFLCGGYFELLDSDGVIFAGTKRVWIGCFFSICSRRNSVNTAFDWSIESDVDVIENQYQVGGYRIFADDEEGAFPIAFLNSASADSGFTAAYFVRIIPNAQEMVLDSMD